MKKQFVRPFPDLQVRSLSTVPYSNFKMTGPVPKNLTKRVLFLRHGQAVHNPRAEEAKDKGCSHDTFMNLMREDDAFDADLTELGVLQGNSVNKRYADQLQDVELVVSSPLSRTLKTADLTICPNEGICNGDGDRFHPPRICVEHFREINGYLLNAKRRDRANLKELFHSRWDFDSCTSETDETWTESLESVEECGERGYLGLLWLSQRKEDNILTVCHGGILRFVMVNHPLVKVVDGRGETEKRFGNCELREYSMTLTASENGDTERPLVTLTEVHKEEF